MKLILWIKKLPNKHWKLIESLNDSINCNLSEKVSWRFNIIIVFIIPFKEYMDFIFFV